MFSVNRKQNFKELVSATHNPNYDIRSLYKAYILVSK